MTTGNLTHDNFLKKITRPNLHPENNLHYKTYGYDHFNRSDQTDTRRNGRHFEYHFFISPKSDLEHVLAYNHRDAHSCGGNHSHTAQGVQLPK